MIANLHPFVNESDIYDYYIHVKRERQTLRLNAFHAEA